MGAGLQARTEARSLLGPEKELSGLGFRSLFQGTSLCWHLFQVPKEGCLVLSQALLTPSRPSDNPWGMELHGEE